MYSGDWDVTGPVVSSNNMTLLKNGSLGAMLNVYSAKKTKELQKIAVDETRRGIIMFGYDVIHGFRTIFPINLGHASSWDVEVSKIQHVLQRKLLQKAYIGHLLLCWILDVIALGKGFRGSWRRCVSYE